MTTTDERANQHLEGLEKVLVEKEQRALKNVVKYFNATFTNKYIQEEDEQFWVIAYNNLLNGLFDVFAYQRPTMSELQSVYDVPEYLTEVYRQKNNDYGDSFTDSMDEYGLYASVVRLSDKINRLEQLGLNNVEQEVNDEALTDTLLDAINYTQMTRTYQQNAE